MPSGRTADFSYPDSNNPRAGAAQRRRSGGPGVVPSWSDGSPAPTPGSDRRDPSPGARAPTGRARAHGDVRIDDWYWLRDKDDPAVIAHLEAENAYTEAVTAGTGRLRAGPLRRDGGPDRGDRPLGPGPQGALALLRPDRRGQQLRDPLPAPAGSTAGRPGADGGRGTHGRLPGDEQVLLDENVLAEGHDYFALGNLAVSPDHRWLAYSTDTTGGERYTMRFIGTSETGSESGEDAPRHLLRRGLGQRQRHRLLRAGRRGHAPVPAVAAPGRHRPGRRRPGLRGAGRALLPRGGPDQGRPVHPHAAWTPRSPPSTGSCPPTSPRASSRSSSRAARASSTASTTTGATRPTGGPGGSSSSPTTVPRTSG